MNFEGNLTLFNEDSLDSKSRSPWLLFFGNSTENITDDIDFYQNVTERKMQSNEFLNHIFPLIMVACYGLVFVAGVAGNCLVIYVVTMFSKMKTVTNMYVVNLAVADVLFLMSMPFLMTTTILKSWVFGYGMCKIYMILVSINYFTGIFTLTIMSADRYMAVCHPVQSVSLRTPKLAFILCVCIWIASILTMMPTFLYSKTMLKFNKKAIICAIVWPSDRHIEGTKAFIWYCFFLSYAIPMILISFFYMMVIVRLSKLGPANKQKEKKKTNRRVTKMVLAIIGVYMMCWLPYWTLQILIIAKASFWKPNFWGITAFHLFTFLTLANSMMNPFLYNFLSDNFRKSFSKAFKCASKFEVSKSLTVENSMCPRNNQCTELTKFNEDECHNYEMQVTKQANTIVKVENTFAQAEKETNVETEKSNVKQIVTEIEETYDEKEILRNNVL